MARCLAVLCLVAASLAAAGEVAPPEGRVLVTVAGEIANHNRGPAHPDDPSMLGHFDMGFGRGVEMDAAMLAALDQGSYAADLTGSGSALYEGPLLSAVLAAAGAEGPTVTLMALDGYAFDISTEMIALHKPILATHRDGQPLGIGDIGPAVTVFPPTPDPVLAESFSERQVWALFFIEVRSD